MSKLKLQKGFAIGMVHLPPVSESRAGGYGTIQRLTRLAREDAHVLQESGFDGILIQNGKDVLPKEGCDPFTVALISAICAEIRQSITIPLGISILKNDVQTALSIAKVTDMQFVRCKVYAGACISGEGMIEACAGEALRCRSQLAAEDVELWSETFDLSSRPVVEMPFEEHLKWCKKMKADSFTVCGHTHEQTLAYCKAAKKIAGDQKVIIGGGVRPDNIGPALTVCDGMIVGSAVEKVPFTGPVCPELAEGFIRALEREREVLKG